ncbi:MAG: hypothetical protein QOF37_1238, partial [Thermoleophilaceae bacterium]|nr:hypothetical protein [Thermoleophilaceae bacterium]
MATATKPKARKRAAGATNGGPPRRGGSAAMDAMLSDAALGPG